MDLNLFDIGFGCCIRFLRIKTYPHHTECRTTFREVTTFWLFCRSVIALVGLARAGPTELGRVGSGWAGLCRIGPARAGLVRVWPGWSLLGRVGPGRAGLVQVGPGWAGLGRVWPGWAGLGQVTCRNK